jgi:hypothetical protein
LKEGYEKNIIKFKKKKNRKTEREKGRNERRKIFGNAEKTDGK